MALQAARVILRERQSNKIPVETLLAKTGLPSINRLMVNTAALECLRAIRVRDCIDACPTPLANLIGKPGSVTRQTRANTAGLLYPPSTSKNSMIWAAYLAWNMSEDLKQAKMLAAAKKAAKSLAALAPL